MTLKLWVTAAGGTSLSVTVTLNVVVPEPVGVPETSPEELRLNPEGRLDPAATDHCKGEVPQLATN